jgi:hypothetical protein
MIRLLIIIALAYAAFWCYNNVNFSKIADDTKSSIQNEKTIKAVRNERDSNYNYEQSVVSNE